jgi:hypothetical protein
MKLVHFVEFQVLMAASMKTAVFWAVAPCGQEKFTDVSEVLAASTIRAVIKAVSTSET